MASTLKVQLTEECVVDGISYSGTRTKTISTITSIFRHIISVGTAATSEIMALAASAGNIGTLDQDTIEYMRITNLDDTNFVELGFEDTSGNNAYYIKVDAGKSFIVPTSNTTTEHPGFFAHDSGHVTGTFVDILSITAISSTAACNIEIFVAMNG